MQIITAAIQKGGVGKTTTIAALTQAAAHKGKKVLAIDLDPQGNLSFCLGADTTKGTSLDLLHGADPWEVMQEAGGVKVIPAARELAAEITSKGSATRLKKALEPLQGQFDFIFIDTPPTAGELQYNALYAATGLIIPTQADIYNLQSLYQIVDTAKQIGQSNAGLEVKGFVLTRLDNRSTIAKQMQEQLIVAANKEGVPYLGSIRNGVAIQEAAALQNSIYDYAPKSKPAQDYLQLFGRL